MSRILTVDECCGCPFFEDGDETTKKVSYCKKLRLSGQRDRLFKVCPLPKEKEDDPYKPNPEGKVVRGEPYPLKTEGISYLNNFGPKKGFLFW